MKTSTCHSCRFWQPGPTQNMAGECRAHAPTLIAFGDTIETRFPDANSDDWCGEWSQRPTCHASYKNEAGSLIRCARSIGHKGACGPLDTVESTTP